MASGIQAIAVVLLLPIAGAAAGAPERYPDDVRSFASHVAGCTELAKRGMDGFGLGEAGCFHFEADRDRLIGRYRGRPKIVAVLKGVSIPERFR